MSNSFLNFMANTVETEINAICTTFGSPSEKSMACQHQALRSSSGMFSVRKNMRDVEIADNFHRFLLSQHNTDLAGVSVDEQLATAPSLLFPPTVSEAKQCMLPPPRPAEPECPRLARPPTGLQTEAQDPAPAAQQVRATCCSPTCWPSGT